LVGEAYFIDVVGILLFYSTQITRRRYFLTRLYSVYC